MSRRLYQKVNVMQKELLLCDIKPGQQARVKKILTTGSMRRRLHDIGLINNTCVECVGLSPLGDPAAYLIRGAVIAIRREDSKNIIMWRTGGDFNGTDA